MNVEPFELIANYAAHPDAHVRRNLTVALSTLATREAVSSLVDMAISDRDPKVRDEAERLLADPNGTSAGLVREELDSRVHTDDETKRQVANDLAGRLYLRGFDLRPPDDRFWRRLRGTWSSKSRLTDTRQLLMGLARRFRQAGMSRRFSFAVIWAGVVGAASPVVVLCLYLWTTLNAGGSAYFAFTSCTFLSVAALTLFLGRRSSPLILQWDPSAAIVRDIAAAALSTMGW